MSTENCLPPPPPPNTHTHRTPSSCCKQEHYLPIYAVTLFTATESAAELHVNTSLKHHEHTQKHGRPDLTFSGSMVPTLLPSRLKSRLPIIPSRFVDIFSLLPSTVTETLNWISWLPSTLTETMNWISWLPSTLTETLNRIS